MFRIILGALLGGLVGLEREVRGQAAGFRTHTLVATGSTLFTLVSIYGFVGLQPEGGQAMVYDPSRIAAQIVVGIGFLGAGAIMRHGTSVKGLTTAASLWVVAALGMSVGAGYYLGAVTVVILLLLVLRGMRSAEDRLLDWVRPDEATLTIQLEPARTSSNIIMSLLAEKKILVRELNIDSNPEAVVLRLSVKLPGKMKAEQVVEELSGTTGVTGAHWKR
ncbi:MAG: MgtC/SapB family protein [Thermoleophilia bacterium]